LFSTFTNLFASSYRILITNPSMDLHMILVTADKKYYILVIKNTYLAFSLTETNVRAI